MDRRLERGGRERQHRDGPPRRGFKPHIKLQVAFTSSPDGSWVQVIQATTGAAGGALGLSKTKKKWRAAVDAVSGGLHSAGLLTGSPQES